MREDWQDIRLREVFALSNARLGAHDVEPVVLSLSKHDGFVPADEYFDRRIASASLDAYKIVAPDDWAFSTIHVDEGSIARNQLGYTGAISPMYTTLRWNSSEHDPGYFELLLRSSDMLARYSENAQGSINRRRSLPFGRFADLSVTVPPLDAQRRIVDVMDALSKAVRTSGENVEALAVLLRALREALFSDAGSSTLRLENVLIDSRRPIRVHADGSYRQIGVRSHGRGVFGKATASGVELGSKKMFAMARGDLVVNIVFAWERAVAVIPDEFDGWCASHRFPTYSTRDGYPIDFVRQFLLSDSGAAALLLASPGGAGRNRTLNRQKFDEIVIPWPSREHQREIVDTLSSLEHAIELAQAEVNCLQRLVVAVQTLLLSGAVEVPATYDLLLRKAA